jgi:hypothetical protein
MSTPPASSHELSPKVVNLVTRVCAEVAEGSMQWSMGASCGKTSARRLLLLTAVAAFGSLALSAPAFAQGGLGSITNAALPKTGTSLDQAVDDNLQAAAPVLDTASPVVDAAAPVLDAAAPFVQAAATVTTPVTQPVSDVRASTLETVNEVVQTVEPPVAGTVPAHGEKVAAASDSTAVRATQSVTTGNGGTAGPSGAAEQAGSLRSNGVPAAASRGRDFGRHGGSSATHPQSPSFTTAATGSWSPKPETAGDRPRTSAKAPGTPSRHGPSVPTPPSSVSAGSFGGGALLVLAALAALLLLAAPGMSRRLRLMLALPPLPVALLPLERPG